MTGRFGDLTLFLHALTLPALRDANSTEHTKEPAHGRIGHRLQKSAAPTMMPRFLWTLVNGGTWIGGKIFGLAFMVIHARYFFFPTPTQDKTCRVAAREPGASRVRGVGRINMCMFYAVPCVYTLTERR